MWSVDRDGRRDDLKRDGDKAASDSLSTDRKKQLLPSQSQSWPNTVTETNKKTSLYLSSSCFTGPSEVTLLIWPVKVNIKGEPRPENNQLENSTPGGTRFSDDRGGGVLYISWCSFWSCPYIFHRLFKGQTAPAFHHPALAPTHHDFLQLLSLMFHSCWTPFTLFFFLCVCVCVSLSAASTEIIIRKKSNHFEKEICGVQILGVKWKSMRLSDLYDESTNQNREQSGSFVIECSCYMLDMCIKWPYSVFCIQLLMLTLFLDSL